MHYHDSDDLKYLGELKQLAPRGFSAFVEFDKIVGRWCNPQKTRHD